MVPDKSASQRPVRLQSRLLFCCKTIRQKVGKAARIKYDEAAELVTTTSLCYLAVRNLGAELCDGQWERNDNRTP